MSLFQSLFDDLKRQVEVLLNEAGYHPASLVLKVTLTPADGWQFEVLAAQFHHASLRKSLAKTATADELLRVLREKVAIPQPQLI